MKNLLGIPMAMELVHNMVLQDFERACHNSLHSVKPNFALPIVLLSGICAEVHNFSETIEPEWRLFVPVLLNKSWIQNKPFS